MASSSTSNEETLETLKFDNLALRTLPIDSIQENYVREVKNACFSKIKPTPMVNPKLVAYSSSAMSGLLGLSDKEMQRNEAVEYFSGNKILPGSETAAHCYCGHQFGVFAGQLGDGAAIYLGEVLNKKSERWEIQLKGAGLTPYSRTADGRKVLRSTIREFLASEAMHFLGVPTTRAGTCVKSAETKVVRDMFYDGNPKLEECAVVLRIAQTFIRFGSFEIFRPLDRTTGGKGPSFGRQDILKTLLDYVSDTFYSHLISSSDEKDENVNYNKYEKVFKEIVRRTAVLVAEWQCVGFVHGVLNTDNMSIYGLTIDYGPYGFLDRYDPDHIFNGSDHAGRYTLRNQPDICEWNCVKLAEVLQPFIELSRSKEIISETFKATFSEHYMKKMRRKLGLFFNDKQQHESTTKNDEDKELIDDLLNTMYETGADFTNSFRRLSKLKLNGRQQIEKDIEDFLPLILNECSPLGEYKAFYKPFMPKETLLKLLEAVQEDPEIVNYLGLSEHIVKNQEKFMKKYDEIKEWTEEAKTSMDKEVWSKWLRKYLARIYDDELELNDDVKKRSRVDLMNANNPRFILRNHLAQHAIEAAASGRDDFSETIKLLKLLERPYASEPIEKLIGKNTNFYERPPELTKCVKLTCSS